MTIQPESVASFRARVASAALAWLIPKRSLTLAFVVEEGVSRYSRLDPQSQWRSPLRIGAPEACSCDRFLNTELPGLLFCPAKGSPLCY